MKKSPGALSSTARAYRAGFGGKAATPKTVARASQLFSATEPPFTRKHTMFRATFKSHPDVAVPMRPATCKTQSDLQDTTPLLCSTSTLLYSTFTLPLAYL